MSGLASYSPRSPCDKAEPMWAESPGAWGQSCLLISAFVTLGLVSNQMQRIIDSIKENLELKIAPSYGNEMLTWSLGLRASKLGKI